jgi:hypothetical protein
MLLGLPPSQVMTQIDEGTAAVERVVGRRPLFFRPPYGQLDAWGSQLVRDRGLELVLWNVEVGDMRKQDVGTMFESLRQQLEYAGGGIVLMHDIRWSSVAALSRLLDWLDARKYDPEHPDTVGFEVVDLVDYIRATAASPQPFPDRTELEVARSAEWRRHHAREPAIGLSTEGAAGVL